MRGDDKRTRLIVFLVITFVFIASMTALVYWAVTAASARTILGDASSFQAPNRNELATRRTSIPFAIENGIKSQPF